MELNISEQQANQYARTTGSRKRKGCVVKFLLVGLSFLLVILLSAIAAFFLIKSDYDLWKKNFLTEQNTSNLVLLNDVSAEEKEAIDTKIVDFSASLDSVNFVELSPREFGILFGRSIQSTLGEEYIVTQVYIDPSDASWSIYFKTKRGDVEIPWIKLILKKVEMESVELKIDLVSVGDALPINAALKPVNDGYMKAVNFVSDSELTNRNLVNIELDSMEIVIKARKR